ncbi:MAG: HD domain-containing protein [Candidatus Methanomethylicaceae archaeon]
MSGVRSGEQKEGYPTILLAKPPKNYEVMRTVAEAFKAAGGRALLVGGAARDILFGAEPKDLDFEVYNLTAEVVEQVAAKLGKVVAVGRAFGILKVITPQGEIDISLPRRENKIGVGHRGFAVNVDPFMEPLEAARRRDFTMNAIAYDPLRNEVLDLYNGAEDIAARRLEVTDPEKFKEDPLRVLRATQFIARYDLTATERTKNVCREILSTLRELPRERVREEFYKLLMKGQKIGKALKFAAEIGYLQEYVPELAALIGIPQNAKYHQEGDAFEHTCLVADAAARLRDEVPQEWRFSFMLAALFHDIGKATTTKQLPDGTYVSYGHAEEGARQIKSLLERLGLPDYVKYVEKLVAYHMQPLNWWFEKQKGNEPKAGAWRRLSRDLAPIPIDVLAKLANADVDGMRGEGQREGQQIAKWFSETAEKMGVLKEAPSTLIRGRDLIDMGFRPGREFGLVIKAAEEAIDRGITRDVALEIIRNSRDLLAAEWHLRTWTSSIHH